jgi:hypothetical protein
MTPALVVPLSKRKLVLTAFGALMFVAAGVWMVRLDDAAIVAHGLFRSPLLFHGAGVLAIVFFGLILPLAVRKLFDGAPGLVADARGLTDNSSALSAGFIPWSDIAGFEEQTIVNQRILYVLLKDPAKYIAACGPVRRFLLRMNRRMGPSPVAISSNALTIGFDDLVAQLRERLAPQN